MSDFILFNLLRLVQNIQNKYDLPEKELNKLSADEDLSGLQ